MKKPTISILIPTYQRPELLTVCLQSIASQKNTEEVEVVVVDNDPKQSAKSSVLNAKKRTVVYLQESKLGHSFAKNKGLKKASGEYSMFLDDDAMVPPGWISRALQMLKTKKPDVIGGPIKPYFDHQLPRWYKAEYEARSLGSRERVLNENEFLPTSSTLIRTSLLKKIGGFNEEYGIKGSMRRFGEDTDVLRRVRAHNPKASLLYAPALEILHFTPHKKTKLQYIFSHHFNLGASGQAVSGDRVSPMRIVMKAAISTLELLTGISAALLFRNTNKYPYAQNYLWERVSPKLYWLGRFYQLLKAGK